MEAVDGLPAAADGAGVAALLAEQKLQLVQWMLLRSDTARQYMAFRLGP